MISSTARDLPEHRKQVIAACERLGFFPLPMENLPADPGDAVRVSLAMVDAAHVYVGIFAHRYGHVPAGHEKSVTEMEYDRARERGLPCLIFFMHDDHPVRASDVEKGPGAEKLSRLKERLAAAHVAGFFQNADDLRAQVLHALTALKKPEVSSLHYVSDVPEPPEVYVAHPYTLLQTRQLVGRQAELNLLTDWVASPRSEAYAARLLTLAAIGGMGKSALTWKWFHDVAPLEMKPLAGRMWWSFYESDAGFDNFLVRGLAYVSRRAREEVEDLPRREVEERLFGLLNREPFLLVLDGLERVLVAYARFDAAHLADGDEVDKQTENRVAGPAEIVGPHRLRKAADPRAGAFLKRLAQVRASRILVSTRLYPSDLQNAAGQPLPGCCAHFLHGLSDDDAVNLWRSLGVSGTREQLLPLFRTFGSHPLLVQTLAGAIANYRPAPGDFDRWRRDHPKFDPFRLPLTQVKTHVLQHALAGLSEAAHSVLESVAGFRMPASYETLAALHVGVGEACETAGDLHLTLEELEGRGLIGWDRRANRYDLHPIVRGVTWSLLSGETREGIHYTLAAHFQAIPATPRSEIKRIEDLAPAVELFNSLVGLRRYDEAFEVFLERLDAPLMFLVCRLRERNELLAMLFADGAEALPALKGPDRQVFAASSLAAGQDLVGSPEAALALHARSVALLRDGPVGRSRSNATNDARYLFAQSLRAVGRLREAEYWLRSLGSAPYGDCYRTSLALLWLKRGAETEARRATEGCVLHHGNPTAEGRSLCWPLRLADHWPRWFLQYEDLAPLMSPIQRQRAGASPPDADSLPSLYFHGRANGDLDQLCRALRLARESGVVEDELAVLVALAKAQRPVSGAAARCTLGELWEAAKGGPYRLLDADACNLLAALERDAGNHRAAADAALRAYRLAWCDGPPFAYAAALETARQHLGALGVPEPKLPPYDDSQYEPLPEVSFDPPPDDLITD
jgi:hypothetical protein